LGQNNYDALRNDPDLNNGQAGARGRSPIVIQDIQAFDVNGSLHFHHAQYGVKKIVVGKRTL
jgi:hypothetical protein